jgi:opacity protein-like surface antigen
LGIPVALIAVTPASALPVKGKAWTGNFAFGYNYLQGRAADLAEDDWYFTAGAVYKPPAWRVGIFMSLSYSNHNIDRDILNELDVDGGDITDVTGAAGIHFALPTKGHVGFYGQAGIAEHWLDANLTEPALISGVVCDPWWWWCAPAAVEGDVIVDSETTMRFGYNAAVGLTFPLASGSELYVEFRMDWIDMSETVRYMPVTFGWRW